MNDQISLNYAAKLYNRTGTTAPSTHFDFRLVMKNFDEYTIVSSSSVTLGQEPQGLSFFV
jgi:hypothetical protein